MIPRPGRSIRALYRALGRPFNEAIQSFRPDSFGVTPRELNRLENLPRRTGYRCSLLGQQIKLTDPFWFRYCYEEIFSKEIYRFEAHDPNPLILDCGANIGLSIIYFKYLLPTSRIIAFEPDPELFRVLTHNVALFGFRDVNLHQKAVWSSGKQLTFLPDGSVGGRVTAESDAQSTIEVEAVRLRDFLGVPVDMLKLDIEGAELEVLPDLVGHLEQVRHLFVEYHGARAEEQQLHRLLTIINEAGFRYNVRESYPIAHPFVAAERERLNYDLILNVFAFRDRPDAPVQGLS